MKLSEFIEQKKAELGITIKTKALEEMCYNRAKQTAHGQSSVGIDDETIVEWLKTYEAWKADEDKRKEAKRKQDEDQKAKYDADVAKRKAQAEAEKREKALAKEKEEKEKEGQLSLWEIGL